MMKWISDRIRPKAKLPSVDSEPERYRGRPLLLIMENYVLDCLGELPSESQEKIGELIRRTWGGGSNWKETVRAELGLGTNIDDSLRAMWTRNQEKARANGISLHPIQFAKMIADENFARDLSGS